MTIFSTRSTSCWPRRSSPSPWAKRGSACAVALLAACAIGAEPDEPIFLAGRGVAPAGDSLFGVPTGGLGAVIRYDRRARPVDTIGRGSLRTPGRVQALDGTWYVSDVHAGQPVVIVLGPDGALRRTVELGGFTRQAHAFAALPDGGVVVEAPDARLVAVRGDSVTTFAVVEIGPRPSLLLGVGGGVLHAVPDHHLTLYNGLGNIRWRVEWPWAPTAYIAALAQDSRGRIHVLAGVEATGTFIAYTLEPGTGEVVRWSVETDEGSFQVDHFGAITPARGRWAGLGTGRS